MVATWYALDSCNLYLLPSKRREPCVVSGTTASDVGTTVEKPCQMNL
jgi:hypothetical protein